MPMSGIEQPEFIQIDETLRLHRYTDDCAFALKWYQDEHTLWLVDGKTTPYTMEKVHQMYHLSELYKLATDYAIIDGGCLIGEFSKETLERACSSGVHVTVEPEFLQEAKTLLASRYPDAPCEVRSNHSLCLHDKIDPADLNQFLVENNVRVCGLGTNEEDIEKFFVEKISGGQAVSL